MEDKNRSNNKDNKHKPVTNMVYINPTILVMTLSINVLYTQVKKDFQNQSE